jgi:hypothetical protein
VSGRYCFCSGRLLCSTYYCRRSKVCGCSYARLCRVATVFVAASYCIALTIAEDRRYAAVAMPGCVGSSSVRLWWSIDPLRCCYGVRWLGFLVEIMVKRLFVRALCRLTATEDTSECEIQGRIMLVSNDFFLKNCTPRSRLFWLTNCGHGARTS